MGRGKWGEGGERGRDSAPVDTGLEGLEGPEGLEDPEGCLMVLTEMGLGRVGDGEGCGKSWITWWRISCGRI